MDDRSDIGINEYAARLIKFKARQLSRRSGFSRTDRGDLEQDMWTDLIDRLPRYNPDKASLNTFIARVVERKVVTILRYHLAQMRSPGRNEASLNDQALDCDGRVVERHQTTPEAAGTWQRLHDLERDVADLRERLPSEQHRQFMDALGRGGTVNSIGAELKLARRAAKPLYEEICRIVADAGFRDYL